MLVKGRLNFTGNLFSALTLKGIAGRPITDQGQITKTLVALQSQRLLSSTCTLTAIFAALKIFQ